MVTSLAHQTTINHHPNELDSTHDRTNLLSVAPGQYESAPIIHTLLNGHCVGMRWLAVRQSDEGMHLCLTAERHIVDERNLRGMGVTSDDG